MYTPTEPWPVVSAHTAPRPRGLSGKQHFEGSRHPHVYPRRLPPYTEDPVRQVAATGGAKLVLAPTRRHRGSTPTGAR